MDTSQIIGQLFGGLSTAAVLFLMAVGLTMIFGILRVLNLAHGSFYLFAAFICSSTAALTSNFWVACIVAPILVALLGGITEVVLFRRVYALPHEYQILLSFGLIYIFADIMKIIWGGRPYFSLRPSILQSGISIGKHTLPYYSIFTIGIAIGVGLSLWAILHKTRLGNLIRAIEQDREVSATLAIDTVKLSTLSFMIGAGIAGVGGAVASGFTVVTLGLDVEVLVLAFVVVVIGGMGSIAGSAIAAVIVGVTSAVGVIILPQFATALMFIILAIVLIIRPWGLLGERLE